MIITKNANVLITSFILMSRLALSLPLFLPLSRIPFHKSVLYSDSVATVYRIWNYRAGFSDEIHEKWNW